MSKRYTTFSFQIDANRFRDILIVIALGLVTLSIGSHIFTLLTGHNQVYGLIHLVDLDYEANIPTYFSSFILLVAAGIHFFIYDRYKNQNHNHLKNYRIWFIMGLVFVLLSADEFIQLHELVGKHLRNFLHTEGLLYNIWIVPGLVFVIVGIFLLKNYFQFLDSVTRKRTIIAWSIYLGSALGLEFFEGYFLDSFGSQNAVYIILVTIEEFGEMIGVILFIYALLLYLANLNTASQPISPEGNR